MTNGGSQAYWDDAVASQNRFTSVGIRWLPESVNRMRKKSVLPILGRIWTEHDITIDDATVLDAGCGTGIYSEFYANHGATVFGVDISENSIETIRQLGIPGTYQQSELHELPFNDDTFELAHCFSVLYHVLDDTEWEESLHELVRVTEPGGLLVMRIEWRTTGERVAEHVQHRSKNAYLSVLAKQHNCKLEAIYPFADVVPDYHQMILGKVNRLGNSTLTNKVADWIGVTEKLERNPNQRIVVFRIPEESDSTNTT